MAELIVWGTNRRGALLLLVAVAGAGCALPLRRTCLDGWPIKILQDPQCPRGICGYTCAPDRWRVDPDDPTFTRPLAVAR